MGMVVWRVLARTTPNDIVICCCPCHGQECSFSNVCDFQRTCILVPGTLLPRTSIIPGTSIVHLYWSVWHICFDELDALQFHLRLILIEGQNKNKSDLKFTSRQFCFYFVEFITIPPLSARNKTRHMFNYRNEVTTMIHIFFRILVCKSTGSSKQVRRFL